METHSFSLCHTFGVCQRVGVWLLSCHTQATCRIIILFSALLLKFLSLPQRQSVSLLVLVSALCCGVAAADFQLRYSFTFLAFFIIIIIRVGGWFVEPLGRMALHSSLVADLVLWLLLVSAALSEVDATGEYTPPPPTPPCFFFVCLLLEHNTRSNEEERHFLTHYFFLPSVLSIFHSIFVCHVCLILMKTREIDTAEASAIACLCPLMTSDLHSYF